MRSSEKGSRIKIKGSEASKPALLAGVACANGCRSKEDGVFQKRILRLLKLCLLLNQTNLLLLPNPQPSGPVMSGAAYALSHPLYKKVTYSADISESAPSVRPHTPV